MENYLPLAERMRPTSLNDFFGQEHLVGPGRPLRIMIENQTPHSLILWGPPGCGKTTLARLIAKLTNCYFVEHSAVNTGIAEVRAVVKDASSRLRLGQKTILFIDEIHRFNKAQQDAFLPYVENGTIILFGATTENPSFEVNAPLLSRCRVYVLKQLANTDVEKILTKTLASGYSKKITAKPEAIKLLAKVVGGDARSALNILDIAVKNLKPRETITLEKIKDASQAQSSRYDKMGEEHYNTISAFIKSMRGSDSNAALYYLAKMVVSGEDPVFIARRMVVLASEDIGNADPFALVVATNCMQAVHLVGMPEARIILAQTATYLASCPKSNASYTGLEEAMADVQANPTMEVPAQLRNAVTKLMKEIGYHKGYKYAHDSTTGWVNMQYLPDALKDKKYYKPKGIGFEQKIINWQAEKRKPSAKER